MTTDTYHACFVQRSHSVLAISGPITGPDLAPLRGRLDRLMDATMVGVLNLSRVTYLSAGAVAVIAGACSDAELRSRSLVVRARRDSEADLMFTMLGMAFTRTSTHADVRLASVPTLRTRGS